MRALFVSNNLIGDALYVGPALRAWIKQQKPDPVEIYLQTLPDHVAPLYKGMVRDLIYDDEQYADDRPSTIKTFVTCFEKPGMSFDCIHTFEVNAAFKLSDIKKQHLARSYADLLNVPLLQTNEALKPIFIPEKEPVDEQLFKDWLEEPILISAFSASCQSRDKNTKGLPPNKMLPFEKWKPIMRLLRKEYPNNPIRFLGAPDDFIPNGYAQDIVHPGEYMLGIPLNRLAKIMSFAKLIVTIDNGMSHLAASQSTPTFLMYPRCLAPHYILPIGNPNLEWIHIEPSLVNPAQLVWALEKAIKQFKSMEVK